MLLEDLPLPGGLAAVVLVGQHHVDPPHTVAEVVSLVRGFGLQHNSTTNQSSDFGMASFMIKDETFWMRQYY